MGIRFTGLVPEVGGTARANLRLEALEVVPMDEDVGVVTVGAATTADVENVPLVLYPVPTELIA